MVETLVRRPLFAFLTLLAVALSWAAPAGAAGQAPERHMEVVQVEGAIDPVVAELITDSIRRAQTNGASVVVLQVNSKGALDTDPAALIDAVRTSKVPVATWVGPGKASAGGAAAALVAWSRSPPLPPGPGSDPSSRCAWTGSVPP